ncbi:MAG: four helix bundle protein [Planctomycetota bacterium]
MAENKPFDICERTFQFANRVLDITSALAPGKEPGVARDQLARAGSSVGSNTEEAMGAISKIEKRKYLGIARRESRESRYWLRIINHRWCPVEADITEATEIRNILSAMIRKLDAA